MQSPNDRWVAPAKCEDAETGKEIEVPLALVVNQVTALAVLIEAVELDLTEYSRQLWVDVLRVQGEVLTLSFVQNLLQVKGHAVETPGVRRRRQVRLVASPRGMTARDP